MHACKYVHTQPYKHFSGRLSHNQDIHGFKLKKKKKSKAHHERDTCTQINEKMRSTMHALTAYCLQWNYINISGGCVYMYVEIYI